VAALDGRFRLASFQRVAPGVIVGPCARPIAIQSLLGLTDLMIAWARARGTEARKFVEFERQFRKDRVAEKVS
jgi:hypothetical protein